MALTDLYAKIGPAGVVLIAVAIVSLFVSVKHLLYLIWMEIDFKKFFARVELGEVNLEKALPTRNPLRRIVTEVAVHHQYHSPDLRSEVSYLFYRYFNKIKAGMAVLRLISVISPLLGLMGTVLGIMKVFKVIGDSGGGTIAQSDLALGIGEAMYTTVMGLVITIPVLALLYTIRLKVSGFQVMMMEYSYRVIGAMNATCPYGKKKS
ncbi:MAG: MotA/TolQ/ExbB proton channel family protein [Pontiella sp.]